MPTAERLALQGAPPGRWGANFPAIIAPPESRDSV